MSLLIEKRDEKSLFEAERRPAAVVINVREGCNCAEMERALMRLRSAKDYTVAVTDTTAAGAERIARKCRQAGLPAIINCGRHLLKIERSPNMAIVTPAIVGGDEPALLIENGNAKEYLAVIGYQNYYAEPQAVSDAGKKYFELLRIADIRDDIKAVEPLVREVETVCFDMRSVRRSDYPVNDDANPNGLYSEEACTIARYIGFSFKLKSLYIYGMEKKMPAVCYRLIAETIFHACEAMFCNICEDPSDRAQKERFEQKIVTFPDGASHIIFLNSPQTGRWWMEISDSNNKLTQYIPCSLSDYNTACNGDVPLRWLFFYQKYIIL